ncbi:hypothetical protein GCM10010038_33410 [Glutamicibacter protophormiae]|nr:hypothetical protein GCM10010038_33410 [Glutamicibacter protophormiae]
MYKVLRSTVHEVLSVSVYEVTRFHTQLKEQEYLQALFCTYQHLQVVPTGGQILDPVHRPSLDSGGQHPARRTGSFSRDGLNKYLPSGRFLGHGDDTLVGEVQQNRRSIDSNGILDHGS